MTDHEHNHDEGTCAHCGGMSHDEYLANIRECIAGKPGWGLVGVLGEGDETPFVYTVGLWENYGYPELLIKGLPHRVGGEILNLLGAKIRDEKWMPVVGADVLGFVGDGGKIPLRFATPVGFPDIGHAFVATTIYRSEDFLVQLVQWPDREGWFPGDSACDPQTVLAQRAVSDYDEPEE